MLLRDAWLFSECTEDELRRITAACTTRAVPAGTVVIREGAHGSACFVVATGHAVVERSAEMLGNDGRPAVIGAVALAGCPHSATITAVTNMRLLALERRTYTRLRAEGGLRSVAHRLDVVVAEQQRIHRCTPANVRVVCGVV